MGVRGVQEANILPAGAKRERAKPQLTVAPRKTRSRESPASDPEPTAVDVPFVEYREYPFPPPGHPVAYPADQPAPDPRFYTSAFEYADEAACRRADLALRRRMLLRHSAEGRPSKPFKKRPQSRVPYVPPPRRGRPRKRPPSPDPVTPADRTETDGKAVPEPKRARVEKSVAVSSEVKKTRLLSRHATSGEISTPMDASRVAPAVAPLPVLSSLPASSSNLSRTSLPPPPLMPLLPAIGSDREKQEEKESFGDQQSRANEKEGAVKERPSPPPVLVSSPVCTPKVSEVDKRLRRVSSEGMDEIAMRAVIVPALSNPSKSPSSGVMSVSNLLTSKSSPGAEGCTEDEIVPRPVADERCRESTPIADVAHPGAKKQADAGKVRFSNGDGTHADISRTRRLDGVPSLSRKDPQGTCEESRVSSVLSAPHLVGQGAMMNMVMFCSTGFDRPVMARETSQAANCQRTIDELRAQQWRNWKEELDELKSVAAERLRQSSGLARGLRVCLDKSFRQRLGDRISRASKDTKRLARQIIDTVDVNQRWTAESNILDDVALLNVHKLDDLQLMTLSLLLELEACPSIKYGQRRTLDRSLVRRISNVKRELERLTAGSLDNTLAPIAYCRRTARR